MILKCIYLGADHLISRGGDRVFKSELFICLGSATNQINFVHALRNHFIFFLHFVHMSMGQMVNNFFFNENQQHFILLS